MVIPHIAIVSGLLLAGNNPNILEGVVEGTTCEPQPAYLHLFALVYESRYRPAWIWRRGRSKKIWIKRVCEGPGQHPPEGLKIKMDIGGWMVGHWQPGMESDTHTIAPSLFNIVLYSTRRIIVPLNDFLNLHAVAILAHSTLGLGYRIDLSRP